MARTMSWTLTANVSGAPSITLLRTGAPLEGLDHVQVVVDPDGKEKLVEVQPGTADRVALLLVSSDQYGAGLTFKYSDKTKDSKPIALTEPQVLVGAAIPLLGFAPTHIKITNSIKDTPATVEVYAFRDATP